MHGTMSLKRRAPYLENKETVVVCLGFHWRDFPATFPFAVSTHALHSTRVLFRSFNKVGNFACETKYLFVLISASNRWILLKRHIPTLIMHALYKIHVWLQLVTNESHVIWKRKKTLRPYLGFHRRVFPETSYFAQIMSPFLKT